MVKELDTVVLTDDVAEYGLKRGDAGYEVEFISLKGETLAVASLSAHQVRPLGEREIAQARVVESTAK